jgi:hypothetical protein
MYDILLTKNINKSNIINIDENFLMDILKKCYNNCSFSTFSYMYENVNSKESIEFFNSGNCVALSMFLKNILNNYNIISFLIPATIPKIYKLDGYLNISHVALAIPLINNMVYILDPAFYFIKPILVNLKTNRENKVYYSKNIYNDTIDNILFKTYKLNKDYKLNKYQTIKKNTYFIDCYFPNDPTDKWKYFITEILNPDDAITRFFINIKNTPFITTTILDVDGSCKLDYYLKFSNNFVTFKKLNKIIFAKNINEITNTDIMLVDKLLFKYFKGNFKKYINYYKKI